MKKTIITTTLVMLALFGVTSAHANLLTNGGFETGDFTGWTTSPLTGIHVDSSSPFSGSYAADLYTPYQLGSISQSGLATIAGLTYELSFWMVNSGTGANEFKVDVNGATLMDVVNSNYSPYSLYTLQFIAGNSPTTVTFYERQDYGGIHVDDANLENVVPEPSSFLLLGIGLVGAGLLRRRNKK